MLTTSNLTWDRKVNQILLSTSVIFCLTIFCLLLKSGINYKTEANFFTIAEEEYEKAKLEAREDKIIEREQIVLKKHMKETCHSKQFRHISTSSSIDSFIIDKRRHFAYCMHAKVI